MAASYNAFTNVCVIDKARCLICRLFIIKLQLPLPSSKISKMQTLLENTYAYNLTQWPQGTSVDVPHRPSH